MLFADYQGAKVAYQTEGTGPALVLVHGTAGNGSTHWENVAPLLASDFTVIRPDYSGTGATEDDGRALSVDYLAGQVLAAADAAGAECFDLVGFSLGSAVAAKLAADYPARVNRLILLAGFAACDARLQLEFELWRELIKRDHDTMAKLVLLTGFSPDAVSAMGSDGVSFALENTFNDFNWEGLLRQVELDLSLDIREALPHIHTPTLVIACTHDHMVPPAHSQALSAAIKDAQLIELPTGHLAPMERPDLLAQAIGSFLGK